MANGVAWLVGLDAVSAVLGLAIAVFFFRIYLATRLPQHLLFTIGLGLVGLTFTTVSASHYDLGADPNLWDHLRIAGQLGGAFVVLLSYISARAHGRARPWIALGWAVVLLSLFFVFVFVVFPPAFVVPSRREVFATAHVVMALSWGATAYLAGAGAHRSSARRPWLVPLAFGLFAISKYTWFLIEVARADNLAFLVYPWRFAGLALLVWALAPAPPKEVTPLAAP